MMLIDMTSDLMPMVYGMHALFAVAAAAVFAVPVTRMLRRSLQPLIEARPTVAQPALGHSR